MSTALYRKWRSQTFDEVVGQEHVTQTLRNALSEDRIAHAYLFAGPRGTGKTSSARILAKALNCTAPEGKRPCNACPTCNAITEGRMIDLIEIDAASNNSVDDIRELRDKVGFRPSEGRYKIYIIDEVHMLSNSAFNALLKTLEEPPPHARFVLATTEPHKIPATVLSRCQRFDFRRIPAPEIAGHLRHIITAEGFGAEDDALLAIARAAQGCMRDAVSLLDQMLAYGAEAITLAQVQQVLGAVNAEAVAGLVSALTSRNVPAGLNLIHKLVTDGASLNEFCQQVVEHLRAIMVLQMTGDAALLDDQPKETVAQLQTQARQVELGSIVFAVKRFSAAVPELKGGYQPQLPLELAFIEAVQGAPVMQAVAAAPAAVAAGSAPLPSVAKPPAAADAQPAEGAAAPKANVNDAMLLQRRWDDILKRVQKDSGPKVAGLLRSGKKDIAASDELVVIAFSDQYEFAREQLDTAETRAQIAAVIAEYVKHPVKLVLQTGDRAELPAGTAPHKPPEEPGRADLLVEFAVSELGAQVVK
jgi:DNA polymerase-3 subunit gamma/tau